MLNRPVDCARAEELLISRSLEGRLDGREESMLATHIDTCPACARFGAGIDEMGHVMAIDEHSPLRPNPAVAAHLRRRLLTAEPASRTVIQRLRDIVGVRIPAYQAALGMAVAFLALFLGVGRLAGVPDVTDELTVGTLVVERPAAIFTRLDTYEVLDKMRMLDRFGRTQAVDSLFSRVLAEQIDTARFLP